MELRCGGVGSQAVGRRMDGDSRDGGGGCKDAGSEDYENLPTSASLSTHMTAGAMAGILEHSVMYPVDSVKVRLEDTLGTERAERRARARTFASRARAAWGSAPKPPLLPAAAGVGRGARHPGSRRERAELLLPPRAWAPGASLAHEGAPAGATHRRSHRLPNPGCWRRCGGGEELASAPGLGGGGGVPEGGDRCSFAQSYHVCPRDPRALGFQPFAAPAGAPSVRAAARGVLRSVQGGHGCPHVRSFRGSLPPGSANHAS